MSAVRLIPLETPRHARDYLAKAYYTLYIQPNEEDMMLEDLLEILSDPRREEAAEIVKFLDTYYAFEAMGIQQSEAPVPYETCLAQRYQISLAAEILSIPFTPYRSPGAPEPQ